MIEIKDLSKSYQGKIVLDQINLQLKKGKNTGKKTAPPPRRAQIDTTARYDKAKKFKKRQMIEESKRKKNKKMRTDDE